VQSVKIVVLEDTVLTVKNVKQVSIVHHRRTIPRPVLHAILEGINLTLDKQTVFHAHQESINTLKEKKHVWIVKLDVRPTLSATIKVNVCSVPLVKRLHELVVQSVRIVVLAGMAMSVSCAKRGSIVNLLWTILKPVLHAKLDDTNQTLGKQTAFHAHLVNTSIAKEKTHVWIVRLDVRPTLLRTMHQSVMHV